MTILIVDDDEDDIEIFKSILDEVDTAKSVTLLTANCGVEALKILERQSTCLPDLIFLDVNMPLLNGLETLERIRQDDRLKKIGVTMYSTSAQFKGCERCISLGANFWQKPTSLDELYSKLGDLITSQALTT